jgi:gamma-tubulin complex component 4
VDELVTAYRARLLDLEQELLAGAARHRLRSKRAQRANSNFSPGRLPASAAALGAALTEEGNLLPAVHGLTASVRREALIGGPLLCRLAERSQSAGDPALGSAYARLLWHVNAAAVRHMAAWMAYGELTDTCGEFFIGRMHHSTPPSPHPADDVPSGSGSGVASAADDDGGAAEWHASVQLRLAHVPPWMDVHTAEGVLFIGKAARMLSPASSGSAHGLSEALALALRPPSVVAGVAYHTKQLLQAPVLERARVEAVVQELRDDAAQRLWTLLVQHANLPAHLAALRAYLLCGRGDLFDTFLEDAKPLLALPPKPSGAAAALATPFAGAASKSTACDDNLFDRVRLCFGSPAVSATASSSSSDAPAGGRHVPSLDAWDPLCLTYYRDWPLGVLLTPGAMDIYGALFQYLFRLKRAHTCLSTAWAPLRRLVSGPGAAALALRHRMDALLAAWTQYCQVDVIEPAHSELLRAVDAAKDWTAAATAHAQCLASMQSGLLLDVKAVSTCLEALFQLALGMQALAANHGGNAATQPVSQTSVDELDSHWRRHAASLLAVLRGPKLGVARTPGWRALLERLEYIVPAGATTNASLSSPLPSGALTMVVQQ